MLMDQRVDLHQRGPLRRQHPDPAGPGLLPALRHHGHRRPRRRCARRSTPTRPGQHLREYVDVVGLGYDVTDVGQPDLPGLLRLDRCVRRAQPSRRPAAGRSRSRRIVGGRRRAAHHRSGSLLLAVPRLAAVVDRRRRQPGPGRQIVQTLERRLRRRPTARRRRTTSPRTARRQGDAFALVRIPRFGADYARPVLEGTDRRHPDTGHRPLHRHGPARARSATSPSPATARPTASPFARHRHPARRRQGRRRDEDGIDVYVVTDARDRRCPPRSTSSTRCPASPGSTPTERGHDDDLVQPQVQRRPAATSCTPSSTQPTPARRACPPARLTPPKGA